MRLYFIECAIFLLIISTRKFTAAHAENVSHQGMIPAKVFTNFLKVPWINLNSSWRGEVTSTCGDDITTLFESADAGESWALQMLDATSKIPAGILSGNIRDLGMYDECIRVRGQSNPANIQGRHCMVSLSMPTELVEDAAAILYIQKLSAYNPTPNVALHIAPSVCLPSSCGVEDIVSFVNASIQSTPELRDFGVEVARVTCSSVDGISENFTLGTILAMSFFAMLAAFLVFCTACDFVVKVRSDSTPEALRTLAKFSLCTNAIKLTSTKIPPGTMPAIHGIRFWSISFVVLIHRFLSTMGQPLVNLSTIHELRDVWLVPFVFILPYAVDTFFIISGFLLSYLFLKKMQSGEKFNLIQLYLHRYLRLTPIIAAMLLFVTFIVPHSGSGPIWEIVLGVTSEYCRKNWWTNLLYVQNFVNQHEMCMPHTWYLAVEMQLFWVSPIFLYLLFHRPKLGLLTLGVLLVASLITPAVHLVVNQYSFLFNDQKIFVKQYDEFIESYTTTYNRALPYFVGILLGYYVGNSKRILTKMQAAFNWTLFCIFILFCLWNTSYIQPVATVYNDIWEAAYVSVGRLGWSLAVAWLLYACTQGYGGPIARFLSLPMFVPLSRISYGIYLVSAMIQVGVNATQRTAEFYSTFKMSYLFCGDLAMSIVAAFVVHLFFETPVVVLQKVLNSKRPSEITKCPSTKKKEKLLAIIKQYSDSTNGRLGSDPAIQARMSRPEFWRTVSDVLNTLGKKPTKTPAEWAKTWQDWKSDLLKNDCEWKTSANVVQIGSVQFETGMSALEKELLIFLAAVCVNLDDDSSFKESKIAELAKSHSVSRSFQNEDLARLGSTNPPPFTETNGESYNVRPQM